MAVTIETQIEEALNALPRPLLWVAEERPPAKPGLTTWSRCLEAWPPEMTCAAGVLRLPLDRQAYEMALHALAARLASGAPLLVWGFNDEGIKSATKALTPWFEAADAFAIRGHARIWRARRSTRREGLRAALADWRHVAPLDLPTGTRPWVSYPGTFARGGLDAGTALLLGHLGALEGLSVLDFGAGTGVIARVVADRGGKITLLERDAPALAAARENVPEAVALLGEALPEGRFDLIVSNPPLHKGKKRSLDVLTALLSGAPRHLRARGALVLVVQRTVPVPRLAGPESTVMLTAESPGYRVWRVTSGRS